MFKQITYQLSYLITSGQLRPGDRVPPVRSVARDIGVNAGTVDQAYRLLQEQGLLFAVVGRGTFVAEQPPSAPDAGTRQGLLTAAINLALRRSRSLGFSGDEFRERVEALAQNGLEAASVVLAAPSHAIGRQYATSLEAQLRPHVRIHVVTFEEVERKDSHVETLLRTAYFVITFARFVRSVEAGLAATGRPHRVIGFGTTVGTSTIDALQQLHADVRLCLITSEQTLDLVQNLVAKYSGHPLESITVCIDGDLEGARRAVALSDRVLYTFTARSLVKALDVPNEIRLEIEFDFTEESVARLQALLVADGADLRQEAAP